MAFAAKQLRSDCENSIENRVSFLHHYEALANEEVRQGILKGPYKKLSTRLSAGPIEFSSLEPGRPKITFNLSSWKADLPCLHERPIPLPVWIFGTWRVSSFHPPSPGNLLDGPNVLRWLDGSVRIHRGGLVEFRPANVRLAYLQEGLYSHRRDCTIDRFISREEAREETLIVNCDAIASTFDVIESGVLTTNIDGLGVVLRKKIAGNNGNRRAQLNEPCGVVAACQPSLLCLTTRDWRGALQESCQSGRDSRLVPHVDQSVPMPL